MVKALLLIHYPQEAENFKYILSQLGNTIAIYDTKINLINAEKWIPFEGLTMQEYGVDKRPWWYILARYSDDYRFWKKVPNSPYYGNRAWQAYPKWIKLLAWLPFGWFKYFYKAPKHIQNYMGKLKPDIILTTSLAFPPLHVAAEFALEGKRRGIPVISLIPNHDALTTKSVMYPIPDYVFCWNDNHEQELIKYHGVRKEQIHQVGAWSFEEWLKPRKPTRRDKFCAKWGLNPDKPIYTYLTSSNSITGWENDLIEKWRDNYQGRQLVVRPHPDKGHLMNLIEGIKSIPKRAEGMFEAEAIQLAYDTIYHSEVVFAVNTSLMINALLVGKIVESVVGNNPDTQEKCLHYRQLEEILGSDGPKKVKKWLNVEKVIPSELIKHKINVILKK